MMRTLPPCSSTKMRPSGARVIAVGALRPPETTVSVNPGGTVAAAAEAGGTGGRAGKGRWNRKTAPPQSRPADPPQRQNCPIPPPAGQDPLAPLARAPGIRTRTAQRLTFHLLQVPKAEAL